MYPHIGLLHALSLPAIENVPESTSHEEALPVTSFSCQWNVPRKRKESAAKISDLKFPKHVYGRQRTHMLRPLSDFDPRGTAPALLQNFLASVKGRGLGVSLLLDKDTRVWTDEEGASLDSSGYPSLPSQDDLKEQVSAFKECLRIKPEKIRQIEGLSEGSCDASPLGK